MSKPGKVRCYHCWQWVRWVDAVCWRDRFYCPECAEWVQHGQYEEDNSIVGYSWTM